MTATQKKRGRRFCSWDCYLKQRQMDSERRKQPCTFDGCDGTAVSRGLCRKHYQRWAKVNKRGSWIEVRCEGCDVIFPTANNSHRKKFCCQECYLSSEYFKEHRRRYAEKCAATHQSTRCLQCDAEILSIPSLAGSRQYAGDKRPRAPRRFCNRSCYRLFMAARFDRYMAGSTELQVPANYDEFLCQEQLPCLVDGCEWVGSNLSMHCNSVHGITADELKALAGFNRTTGVVSALLSRHLAGRAQQQNFEGRRCEDLSHLKKPRGPTRPEGIEHLRKAAALKSQGKESGDE